jgi:uncharacterized protein YlxW (UPF0749 family)
MPCDPVSMTFGSLALGAVGTVTKFMGDSQQASQQATANTAAEQSARDQYVNATQQEALRQQQEAEAVSQRVMATNTELAEKMATARVSAGEAGVSGLSVDSLMRDYLRQADVANESAKR